MAIKKYRTFVLLVFLGLVNLQFECNKKIGCAENVYSFELDIKAYPDKDSINVGDTIWLEVNSPTTLKDFRSGSMVDYSGAKNLGTAIGIAELISVNVTNTEGNSFFKYNIVTGTELPRSDSNRFREFNFAEVNQKYQFKLALIPLKKGIFKLFISNAANVYRKNDGCTKAGFGISFKDTDQHFYFNEVSFPGIILSGQNGVYLFKVK